MKNEKKQVPYGALCLGFEGPTALTQFEDSDDKKPKMNMVIYSGGIIKNHWYWDDLVLDLTGVKFLKNKYPILERHDTDLKIAFHNGPLIVDTNLRVDPEKTVFVSTPESEQFQRVSAEGFPYQASARVNPLVIERISEGAFAEANGIKVKGPGTIFRKWEFIEGSVCVFGYDTNTSSSSFEKTQVEIDCKFEGDGGDQRNNFFNSEEEKAKMDYATLQKEHPVLLKQIEDGILATFSQTLDKKVAEISTQFGDQVKTLETTIQAQATQLKAKDDQILNLEKNDALRNERDLQLEADGIWEKQLAKSEIIPEHMFEKISKHVSHTKFVDAETGKCDFTKFTEAVQAEIKDWETRLGKPVSTVRGTTYAGRTAEDTAGDTELEEKDNKWLDKMVGLAQDGPGAEE